MIGVAADGPGNPMATIDVPDAGASGLVLQLDSSPPRVRLWQWGTLHFDDASLRKGQLEVRQRGLKELDLPTAALIEPGQWNLVEVFYLGAQVVYRINGQMAGAVANPRQTNADGKEMPVERGGIALGAGTGTTFFRRIELRPILGLPPDFPDSP